MSRGCWLFPVSFINIAQVVHEIWWSQNLTLMTCCDLDPWPPNLIWSSVEASEYSLSVLSKLFKPFMCYGGNNIWLDKRMYGTAYKDGAFTVTIGHIKTQHTTVNKYVTSSTIWYKTITTNIACCLSFNYISIKISWSNKNYVGRTHLWQLQRLNPFLAIDIRHINGFLTDH